MINMMKCLLFTIFIFGVFSTNELNDKQGMEWFHNLDEQNKSKVIAFLSQDIANYGGHFNENVIKDMKAKFDITSQQTKNVYEFVYNVVPEPPKMHEKAVVKYDITGPIPTKKPKEKISQYHGVFWHQSVGRWYVSFDTLQREKPQYFGSFDDEMDAGKKVNQICEQLGIPPKNPGLIGTKLNQQSHPNDLVVNECWKETLNDAAKRGDRERVQLALDGLCNEGNEKLIKILMKENDALHFASYNGRKEIVNLLFNAFNQEEKNKLIEYVMKEDKFKATSLQLASHRGYEGIVKLLLNTFGEKEEDKLIEYVMKENINKVTALHFASHNGHERVVKLLLNTFRKKSKLIEYVIKENANNNTALHFAAHQGNEDIVKLLLNVFGREKEKEILIEYLMKENTHKNTALQLASQKGNQEIVKLLTNAMNSQQNPQEII